MNQLLAVGIGGFVGAITRHGITIVSRRAYAGPFPVGTFAVNMMGCFIIGILMTLVQEKQMFSLPTRLLVITGFLGSLTTFSTYGYETMALARGDEMGFAIANVLANTICGLIAVWLGSLTTRLIGT